MTYVRTPGPAQGARAVEALLAALNYERVDVGRESLPCSLAEG